MYSSRTRRNSKPHVSPERRHSKDSGGGGSGGGGSSGGGGGGGGGGSGVGNSMSVPGNKLSRLQRQSTAIDESCMPAGPYGRRSSQPTLSADPDYTGERKTRRDSLSPDSAHYARRRDSRVSVSITPYRYNSYEGKGTCHVRRFIEARAPSGSNLTVFVSCLHSWRVSDKRLDFYD